MFASTQTILYALRSKMNFRKRSNSEGNTNDSKMR